MPSRQAPHLRAHRLDKQTTLSIITERRNLPPELQTKQHQFSVPFKTPQNALGAASQQLIAQGSVYIHYQSHQSLLRASTIKNI